MGLFGKPEPEAAEVEGHLIRCETGHHGRFWHRRAQLHSQAATFFDLEWASPNCDCYVRDRCGYIHWFLPKR